jgi:hypothetical protein
VTRHLSPLRVWLACLGFVAATTAAIVACGPVDGECGGETNCETTTTTGGGR